MRQVVPPELLANFDREKIKLIVSRLAHMRVFASDHSALANAPVSRLVPNEHASVLLGHLMASALRYTLLLNKVDTVDNDVLTVRKLFGVPHSWRVDDIVVTWSTNGSGIGYHAGHEDAIIVQAAGRRHWRVWSASEVDIASRRRILISAPGDDNKIYASGAPSLLDCELEPGDAIYIPPFCPHEGLTLHDSVSIALGWRGVAYFHMVDALRNDLVPPSGLDANALPDAFFDLIPDIDPNCLEASRSEVADRIIARLINLGCSVSAPASLSSRIQMILGGPVA